MERPTEQGKHYRRRDTETPTVAGVETGKRGRRTTPSFIEKLCSALGQGPGTGVWTNPLWMKRPHARLSSLFCGCHFTVQRPSFLTKCSLPLVCSLARDREEEHVRHASLPAAEPTAPTSMDTIGTHSPSDGCTHSQGGKEA